MGYTQERGAEKVETCAIVRWATTSKAADWQATWRIAYAFGLLRIGGIALEEKTEVDAAVSLFSYAGYQTEKFAGLMLEKTCVRISRPGRWFILWNCSGELNPIPSPTESSRGGRS